MLNVSSRADTLSLVGGILALDFANTRSGLGTDGEVDHLQEPAHLLAWAEHAGILKARDRRTLSRGWETELQSRRTLARALAARDHVYDLGAALAARRQPAEQSLDALRDLTAAAIRTARLTCRGDGPAAFDFQGAGAFDAVLGPVVLSMVDLLRQGSLERLKQCPGPHCGWLFYDRSKNNSRRWCDMAVCGNRVKGRRHRVRLAEEA